MPNTPQTYQNHVRYHAPFHFVLAPLVFINLIWSIVSLFLHFGTAEIKDLLVAILLLLIGVLSRTNALKAQDRVIRLEEQLRYQRILPTDLVQRASALSTSQIISLRFASDEELAGLIQQTLDRKFAKTKEIKEAIKNWRGDYLRV
ncbi:MAG: hypothetical protein JST84_30755 [Acidobacteria bacterium]|nr:hypothetical protein [Acidobacteriota bacterium]